MLIYIEGIDGSGKSTLAVALAKHMGGFEVWEPWYSYLATEAQRCATPAAKALVFWADRIDLYASIINPHLAAGHDVVSDRSWLSTVVYQGEKALSLALATSYLPNNGIPDLILYLDLPGTAAMERMELHDKVKGREHYERLRRRYLELIGELPGLAYTIDATMTPAQIREQAIKVVESLP